MGTLLPVDQIADRFFDAFCAGDAVTLRACLAPGFRAWHNNDLKWQEFEEHLGVLAWLKASITDMHYEDVEREMLADGFVQRHVLAGSVRGEPFALYACVFARLNADGLLTETREYLDSKQLRALFQRGSE